MLCSCFDAFAADIKSSDVNADKKHMVAVARGCGQERDLQQGDPLPFSLPKSWSEIFTVEITWSFAISPQQLSICYLS